MAKTSRLLKTILDEYGVRIADADALTPQDKDMVLFQVGKAYDRMREGKR